MYRLKHLGYATASYISAIVEQEKASIEKSENSENQDRSKGAMEQDKQRPNSHTGMDGHLSGSVEKR
jgi:hypothetical protein